MSDDRARDQAAPTVPLTAAQLAEVTAAAPLAVGTELAGRYRIEKFLARGGMGAVYEATDRELGVTVALKTVRPDLAWGATAVERFKREIQLAREVTHPGVCRIFDLGRHEQADGKTLVFLTMELLRGATLADRLTDGGKLPVAEARAIVLQICEALAAAHAAGVVHRDLKPSNVIRVERGGDVRAVITDFGLARELARGSVAESEPGTSGASVTSAVSHDTVLAGTPAYMAPEQFAGGSLTPACDIHALGVVMFELVTGELPWTDGTGASGSKRAVSEERIAALAALDARWAAVVRRCLAVAPGDRYASVAELVRAIEPPRRRKRALVVAGVALAASVAAGVALVVLGSEGAADPCATARDALTGAWDVTRRGDVARAFAQTGDAGAAAALPRVEAALDRHTTRWVDLSRDLCRDRAARRVPPAELAARGRCLQRALVGTRALTRQLAGPLDASTARAAVGVVESLESLEPCADGPALVAADSIATTVDDALDEQLAEVEVLVDLARYDVARTAADKLVRAAAADERRQVMALYWLGVTRLEQGDIAAAEAPLREAIRLGARIRDDVTIARAWVALVRLLYQGGRLNDAMTIADVASSAVVRAGSDPRLVLVLETNLAIAETWSDHYERAIPRLDKALADGEKTFGAYDPDVLQAMIAHAENLNDVGRSADALALAERVRRTVVERFGTDDIRYAQAQYLLGVALRDLDRHDEARPLLEAVLVAADVLDSSHPARFHAQYEVSRLYKVSGDLDRALSAATEAVTRARALPGPDLARVGLALGELGDVHLARGELDLAERTWTEALEVRVRSRGEGGWAAGRAHSALGQLALARGDDATARRHLELAITALEKVPVPTYVALARARLARALWSDPSQRARARELAAQARPALARPNGERPVDLDALVAWTSSVM